MRRLRLGDVQKVLRQRYRKNGHTLTDDDAGREDLRELLLPISLGQEAGRKMENAVQVWAPWMPAAEAGQLMDEINRAPHYLRKPTAREVGERLRLTYQERQAWGIRTIAPCDVTDEELLERRKARASFLRWKRRRAAGKRTRAEYRASFAGSISKTKQWLAEGFKCRRTWERHRAKSVSHGVSAIKLINRGTTPCDIEKKEDCRESKLNKEERQKDCMNLVQLQHL